jgi:putative heme-binding domain-containing protein
MKHALPTPTLLRLARDGTPAQRLGAVLVLRESADPEATRAVPVALADAEPDIRFAAVQWVAESKLGAFRPQIEKGLTDGALSQNLFEAHLAALERLDGRSRIPTDELAGEGYVAALVTDPKRAASPALLRRALRALRPDHPALTLNRLSGWLQSDDPGVRLEAVRTLRDGGLPGRFDLLAQVATDPGQPTEVRAEAVVGLATADLADASRRRLLVDLASGSDRTLRDEALRSLRGASMSRPERDRLPRNDPEAAALVAAIDGFPTAARAAEPLASWLAKLGGPADPGSGARVFFHPKGPGCYRCHQVDGRGGRTGPDLSATGSALTLERLVESVVDPSKEVAPQFTAWNVALKDGRVFTGTLLRETDEGLVFGDAQGKLVTVKPSEVDEKQPQKTSIMPADLAAQMTAQEFRDLIAYLRAPRR